MKGMVGLQDGVGTWMVNIEACQVAQSLPRSSGYRSIGAGSVCRLFHLFYTVGLGSRRLGWRGAV
jgi:hypothetical protein